MSQPPVNPPLVPSVVMERVVAGVALFIAFVIMASVFTPDHSEAQGPKEHDPVGHMPEDELTSVDPHEGLRSLGALEHRDYTVRIYMTERGPRYSVFENGTGTEMGVLMTAEKVQQRFPELPLPSLDFSATEGDVRTLMLAE